MAGSRPPRPLSTNGRIAFQAQVGRDGQVFTIRPDGKGLTQVTDLRTDDPGAGRLRTVLVAGRVQDRLQHRDPIRGSAIHARQPVHDRARRQRAHRTAAGGRATSTETRRTRRTASRSPSTRTSARAQPTVHGIFIADSRRQRRPAPDHELRHQGRIRHRVAVVARRHDDRVHQGQERTQGGDLHDPHRRHRADPADPVQARRRESRLVARRIDYRLQQLLGLARRQGGKDLHDAARTAAT